MAGSLVFLSMLTFLAIAVGPDSCSGDEDVGRVDVTLECYTLQVNVYIFTMYSRLGMLSCRPFFTSLSRYYYVIILFLNTPT